ncbi:DUF3306 domain-containing protein [Marimonas arenosa]|uniref:DUF3306 domain-containing protein n=1 Tax=Marimonas arenosa TaxID=1795305 RepID=A0AAE3WGD7_9RHOB|nr:DUF3306 domain-containing protein [Marimonas arenosa]MDQ2092184.1 DUF3306 domain-containing protein [Marimonas arenosa]
MKNRDDEEEGLFSRWSRLKRSRPAEPSAPQPAPASEPEQAEDLAPPESEEDEAALLARLDLPVPESLAPGDDFSRFMSNEVPAFLRQRALRVLWRSNPDLAVLDGLVDYGEDFRSGDITGVIQTAYRVGRGFLKDKTEEDPEAAETPAAAPVDDGPEQAPATAAVPDDLSDSPPAKPDTQTESAAAAPLPDREAGTDRTARDREDRPLPPPGRMVFTDDG